jgi:hypothetical protein
VVEGVVGVSGEAVVVVVAELAVELVELLAELENAGTAGSMNFARRLAIPVSAPPTFVDAARFERKASRSASAIAPMRRPVIDTPLT